MVVAVWVGAVVVMSDLVSVSKELNILLNLEVLMAVVSGTSGECVAVDLPSIVVVMVLVFKAEPESVLVSCFVVTESV